MKPRTPLISYADNVSVNLNDGTSHQESLNTTDAEGHNWGWSISNGQNTSVSKNTSISNNTSSSHNVGMSRGVFAIYDEWVRSYRDMTGVS